MIGFFSMLTLMMTAPSLSLSLTASQQTRLQHEALILFLNFFSFLLITNISLSIYFVLIRTRSSVAAAAKRLVESMVYILPFFMFFICNVIAIYLDYLRLVNDPQQHEQAEQSMVPRIYEIYESVVLTAIINVLLPIGLITACIACCCLAMKKGSSSPDKKQKLELTLVDAGGCIDEQEQQKQLVMRTRCMLHSFHFLVILVATVIIGVFCSTTSLLMTTKEGGLMSTTMFKLIIPCIGMFHTLIYIWPSNTAVTSSSTTSSREYNNGDFVRVNAQIV